MTEEAPPVEVGRDGETTVRHGEESITASPDDPTVEEVPDGWTVREDDGVLDVETPGDRVTLLGPSADLDDRSALPDDPEHVVSAAYAPSAAQSTLRAARNVAFVDPGEAVGVDPLPPERAARAAGRGTGRAVSTATHGSVAVRRDGEDHVVETEADPGEYLYDLAATDPDDRAVERPTGSVERSELHRHVPNERETYDSVVERIEAAEETGESRYLPDGEAAAEPATEAEPEPEP
jgi:hypothetical protein